MISNPKIDSALHILKGAVENVLGAKITTNVYEEGDKGRLTVEFNRKPSNEEIRKIEEKSSQKISENIPIEKLEMDREDAEKQFGDSIYDKFPVPSHIKKLTIIRIKDWNINCCIGKHLSNTGDIKKISIIKYRFREPKNQLEISFFVD